MSLIFNFYFVPRQPKPISGFPRYEHHSVMAWESVPSFSTLKVEAAFGSGQPIQIHHLKFIKTSSRPTTISRDYETVYGLHEK